MIKPFLAIVITAAFICNVAVDCDTKSAATRSALPYLRKSFTLTKPILPPGSTVTVGLPATSAAVLTESGKQPSIRHVRHASGAAVYEVESGTYAFTTKAKMTKVPVVAPKRKQEPHIVNLYNFIRENDFRLDHSEDVLFDATEKQVELVKQAKLPATFALQYDALIDPRYQHLLKTELPSNCEIGAWWEIPQALAEKAGLTWHGEHEWDPRANIGFAPGFTPDQRRRLVDIYMADFHAIFGYYPKTVGSWYIDEVTLDYMSKKYGVIASCNCRDQIGTDFYTLWGGYWNQAYYPSKVNAYMPAQTAEGQIDVPIFRMLGSDPIYEHGPFTPGIHSLEPVYGDAGGSSTWVDWFLRNMIEQPSLSFAYTQAGQENSFGWDAMKNGLTMQVAKLAELERAGHIQMQTLAQTGEWFRKRYPLTPAASTIALDDWKNKGHKSVWYNNRFYRLNALWQDGTFFIRDLHKFDEDIVSPTHSVPLTVTTLTYQTLPIMDWAMWSKGDAGVGMWPVMAESGQKLAAACDPNVAELSPVELQVRQPLINGQTFEIICRERSIDCAMVDVHGKPLPWAWRLHGDQGQNDVVRAVKDHAIVYHFLGEDYRLTVKGGQCRRTSDGDVEIVADPATGRVRLGIR